MMNWAIVRIWGGCRADLGFSPVGPFLFVLVTGFVALGLASIFPRSAQLVRSRPLPNALRAKPDAHRPAKPAGRR